jgi:hypothetical protein
MFGAIWVCNNSDAAFVYDYVAFRNCMCFGFIVICYYCSFGWQNFGLQNGVNNLSACYWNGWLILTSDG